jgi:hypothetical protein
VRQIETFCTGAHRNRTKRTEVVLRKPNQTRADRSSRERHHRSLDHGIGVRIPASQPITPTIAKSFYCSGLLRSISVCSARMAVRAPAVTRRNVHDLNGLTGIGRVRIPSRCCTPPKRWS